MVVAVCMCVCVHALICTSIRVFVTLAADQYKAKMRYMYNYMTNYVFLILLLDLLKLWHHLLS